LKLKRLDGRPNRRWRMFLNATLHAKPYHSLTGAGDPTVRPFGELVVVPRSAGAAWSSSVRVVRCPVQSSNERNLRVRAQVRRTAPIAFDEEAEGSRCQILMALMEWAGNVLQGWAQCEAMAFSAGASVKAQRGSDRGLQGLREGGIGSNRGSEGRGEHTHGRCTSRPSRPGRKVPSKDVGQPTVAKTPARVGRPRREGTVRLG